MPRFSTDKTKVSVKDKIQRAKSYRVSGYTGFIDPFPLGFGTLPEKIVYNELSKRGIRFYYLNDIDIEIPELNFQQWFQADFYLPDFKIIIEVQGAHWHSMPATIDADALKFAYYQYMGLRPLAWWDFDIERDVTALFRADPQLSQYSVIGNTSTELMPYRRTKTDSSKGIRTLNAKRGQRLLYKKKAATVKTKRIKSYATYTTG